MAVRADERQSRYCPVECSRCGALVRAAKFSPQHTSVQWDAAALDRCAEFAAAVAASRPTALVERCASMRSSIDDAAADGRLPVAPPWPDRTWSDRTWSDRTWSDRPRSDRPRPGQP
jgi:hypothetical protein